jgi:tetratricopeptide (TPR) repeat protein
MPTNHQRPAEKTPGQRRSPADMLTSAYVVIPAVLTLLMGVAFCVFAFQEAGRVAIVVHPVNLPPSLKEDEGYDSERLAERVVAELVDIDRLIYERAKTDRLTAQFARIDGMQGGNVPIVESHNLRDIEIAETGISFRSLVGVIKSWRGTEDLIVNVNVVRRAGGSLTAQVSVTGGWIGKRVQADTVPLGDVESVMREAGRQAIWLAEPHVLAGYEIHLEDQNCARQPSCDYGRALALLDELEGRANVAGAANGTERLLWVLVAQSNIQMRLGKFEDVAALARRAVAIDADFAPAYFNWVNALLGRDLYPEAVQVAKVWSTRLPNDPEAYEYLGTALERDGKSQEAVLEYAKSLDLAPSRPVVYVLWGNLLDSQRQFNEATEKYQRASELDARDPAAHTRWGWMLVNAGRHEEAIGKFQLATARDDSYPPAQDGWGRALVATGKHAEALGHFEKAVLASGYPLRSYREWGDALEALGRHDEAVEKYARADPAASRTP